VAEWLNIRAEPKRRFFGLYPQFYKTMYRAQLGGRPGIEVFAQNAKEAWG